MTYSPMNVGNSLLKRSFNDGIPITLMKLQRLTYFTASEYSKISGKPLLNESFQTWSYGPVLRTLHDKFSVLGSSPITKYGKDAQGNAYCVDEEANPELETVLDRVWDSAKNIPAVTLSRMTHLPDSAWSKAYTKAEKTLDLKEMEADVSYQTILGLQ